METLRNRIQMAFIERAPNSLTLKNFGLLLGEGLDEIGRELDRMVEEGIVQQRTSPQKTTDYMLKSYAGIPVREFVSISGLKVPRLIHGDTARPEDLNLFFEVLATRLLSIEIEAERKMDERLKSYWGNVVTLFGAFIGVFSLIVAFLKIVPIEKDATFFSVFSLMSAQVIPLAIVLAAFVWFLRSQFR